jgi:hypothetical protein
MQNTDQTDRGKLDFMNHPSREEWMSYLYDELPPSSKTQLTLHLETCAACRKSVAEWQTAMKSLETWELSPKHSLLPAWQPFLKWGIAALFVLGLGYGIGRVSVPASNMERLRAGIETSLRPSLEKEIRDQVRADLRAEMRSLAAVSQMQFTNGLRQVYADMNLLAEKTLAASTDHAQRLLALYDDNRSEENQTTRTALGNLNTAQRWLAAEYGSFRKEVETLALLTEDGFQRVNLASHNETGHPQSQSQNHP